MQDLNIKIVEKSSNNFFDNATDKKHPLYKMVQNAAKNKFPVYNLIPLKTEEKILYHFCNVEPTICNSIRRCFMDDLPVLCFNIKHNEVITDDNMIIVDHIIKYINSIPIDQDELLHLIKLNVSDLFVSDDQYLDETVENINKKISFQINAKNTSDQIQTITSNNIKISLKDNIVNVINQNFLPLFDHTISLFHLGPGCKIDAKFNITWKNGRSGREKAYGRFWYGEIDEKGNPVESETKYDSPYHSLTYIPKNYELGIMTQGTIRSGESIIKGSIRVIIQRIEKMLTIVKEWKNDKGPHIENTVTFNLVEDHYYYKFENESMTTLGPIQWFIHKKYPEVFASASNTHQTENSGFIRIKSTNPHEIFSTCAAEVIEYMEYVYDKIDKLDKTNSLNYEDNLLKERAAHKVRVQQLSKLLD
jgi:hypothetical protein